MASLFGSFCIDAISLQMQPPKKGGHEESVLISSSISTECFFFTPCRNFVDRKRRRREKKFSLGINPIELQTFLFLFFFTRGFSTFLDLDSLFSPPPSPKTTNISSKIMEQFLQLLFKKCSIYAKKSLKIPLEQVRLYCTIFATGDPFLGGDPQVKNPCSADSFSFHPGSG